MTQNTAKRRKRRTEVKDLQPMTPQVSVSQRGAAGRSKVMEEEVVGSKTAADTNFYLGDEMLVHLIKCNFNICTYFNIYFAISKNNQLVSYGWLADTEWCLTCALVN
jgi:hypothetical protein